MKTGLRFAVPKCCKVIVACVVLHNFARINAEPDPSVIENVTLVEVIEEDLQDNDVSARHVRTLYINSLFSSREIYSTEMSLISKSTHTITLCSVSILLQCLCAVFMV